MPWKPRRTASERPSVIQCEWKELTEREAGAITLSKAATEGKGNLSKSADHERLFSSIQICQSSKEQEKTTLNVM